MTFSEFKSHSEPLFKKLQILKFRDSLVLNNCLFVYDYFHTNLPNSFHDTFTRTDDMYEYSTRQATSGKLHIPKYETTTFGLKCIYKRCIDSWNKISTDFNLINRVNNTDNTNINDIDLLRFSRTVFKDKLSKHILSTYEEHIN